MTEPLTSTRTLESQRYQASVDTLRAKGCRCMLRWNGMAAVPVTQAESAACVVVHDDHREE